MDLFENERLDRVNDSLLLIQKTDGLTFGTDALLLAAYIDSKYESGTELGSGSGIISMLLLSREKLLRVSALEVQESYAALTERNAALNFLSDRLTVENVDVRDYTAKSTVDCVFTNPPYMKSDSGKRNGHDAKNIARHEICGDIFDFLLCAGKALKYGGDFYCVYRPDRMTDLLCSMRESKIEPKRITTVYANQSSEPSMILVMGKKNGKASLKFTRPLFIYSDSTNTSYTSDMEYILENGSFPPDFTKLNAR